MPDLTPPPELVQRFSNNQPIITTVKTHLEVTCDPAFDEAWINGVRYAPLPEGPAVTPAADDRGPGSVVEQDSPVATDEDIRETLQRTPGTIAERCRAIYNLGREHGAAGATIRRALELVSEGPAATPDPAPTAGFWERHTMNVCPVCGNKRCPKGADPAMACTGSNEPGQPGSAYVDPAPTADGGVPLWKAMHAAYERVLQEEALESGHFYAAELRAVADWLERMGHGTPWMEASEVFATSLRAEADRAEAS